ncbi:hypothetical protein ACR79M_08280 [Sphingobacterium spiritivorum]|uniref:hypothetical protein n=1 Tax=Sphingobacterium spiritivorum TaxID=258 RepID=UPI003DA52170
MRISEEKIVQIIDEAIATNIYAQGIAMRCDVVKGINKGREYIEFTPKPGETIKPEDWFWFGYYLREYVS